MDLSDLMPTSPEMDKADALTEDRCECGHLIDEHQRCDFPGRDDCTVCTCGFFNARDW